ncbi:hypothetical protein ES332_D01G143600v1 [Gossypium tomentosum]|uniref:Uncharacterized protein n=1 Tax=Gossypium tomentosum TaxID=34277 RepID=A0A5D2M8T5_GOSTO|nr:hypothetical protein ES332_D01G143600v1 [Gossypium tomentosum]
MPQCFNLNPSLHNFHSPKLPLLPLLVHCRTRRPSHSSTVGEIGKKRRSNNLLLISSYVLNYALVLNYGSIFSVFLCLFYVLLDKKAGSLAALLYLACWVGASFIAAELLYSLAWKIKCLEEKCEI